MAAGWIVVGQSGFGRKQEAVLCKSLQLLFSEPETKTDFLYSLSFTPDAGISEIFTASLEAAESCEPGDAAAHHALSARYGVYIKMPM